MDKRLVFKRATSSKQHSDHDGGAFVEQLQHCKELADQITYLAAI